jgi:hypothetical protein
MCSFSENPTPGLSRVFRRMYFAILAHLSGIRAWVNIQLLPDAMESFEHESISLFTFVLNSTSNGSVTPYVSSSVCNS